MCLVINSSKSTRGEQMTKSAGLLGLFSLPTYKTSYVKAKATSTCIRCGEPAKVFRDASARFEYKVSALCQRCQDSCFGGSEQAK